MRHPRNVPPSFRGANLCEAALAGFIIPASTSGALLYVLTYCTWEIAVA